MYGFLVLLAMVIVQSTTRFGYLAFCVLAAIVNIVNYCDFSFLVNDYVRLDYVGHASLLAVLFATIMRQSAEYKNKVNNNGNLN